VIEVLGAGSSSVVQADRTNTPRQSAMATRILFMFSPPERILSETGEGSSLKITTSPDFAHKVVSRR
jgi:hypothetical protein